MRVCLITLCVCCLPILAGGCDSAQAKQQALPAARQYIVLIDLSASRNEEAVSDSKQYVLMIVNHLSFGDELVLMQVKQNGLADHARRWKTTLPTPQDPSYISSRDNDRLAGAQKAIRSVVPEFFKVDPSVKIAQTDLFTSLDLASQYVGDAGGRRIVLILLSDMLQSTKTVEMSHLARMPGNRWLDTQKRDKLLPNFTGACVAVIGADTTNSVGATVRSFWQKYFSATGAVLPTENYRILPPSGIPTCK